MDSTEAFVVTAPREGTVREWPLPGGEVTVEIEACAICRRDAALWNGTIPRTLPDVFGHEVVGRIVDARPDVPWPAGTRVAGMGIAGLARHMRVPAWQLAPVPEAGPHLALVEPLACAINAVEQDQSPAGAPAIVVGLGLLGQLVAELTAANGRPVMAVDRDPARRRLAESADVHTIEPTSPELSTAIREARAGYECSGDEDMLWRLSTELCPGASLLLVAHHREGRRQAGQLLDRWHRGGLAVRNPVPWTATDMVQCIRVAAALPVDLTRYPLRTAPLDQAPQLLDRWPIGTTMRHVITPGA